MIWEQIDEIVAKTIIAAHPHLVSKKHKSDINGNTFQILGFDILIDSFLKAHLLEVNSQSSLQTNSALDSKVKFDMIFESLALVAGNTTASGLLNSNDKNKDNKN